MLLGDITKYLEQRAPLALQENYDNSGLIVGHSQMEITGAVICLDSIEEVIDEAISLGYNLVIAHHPIVFSGLKKLTGKNYVERTVLKAIKNDIAIYAIHTNLDNVIDGVNFQIAQKLGLQQLRILQPKSKNLVKLEVFVPKNHLESVRTALFTAGAGQIGNYSECSFASSGEGTFKASERSNPFVGEKDIRHVEQEMKLEAIMPQYILQEVLGTIRSAHPYEEIAYQAIALENQWQDAGSGMIGELAEPIQTEVFLNNLKQVFGLKVIKHTSLCKEKIQRIAVCGGSGSFLIGAAKRSGVDLYITSDIKYHEFFDADGDLIVADIGHFESEQYTIELLSDWLAEKFPTFAVRKTRILTNPINYL
jgi:dinuclear metal center YbgI/SA1388 family protein